MKQMKYWHAALAGGLLLLVGALLTLWYVGCDKQTNRLCRFLTSELSSERMIAADRGATLDLLGETAVDIKDMTIYSTPSEEGASFFFVVRHADSESCRRIHERFARTIEERSAYYRSDAPEADILKNGKIVTVGPYTIGAASAHPYRMIWRVLLGIVAP